MSVTGKLDRPGGSLYLVRLSRASGRRLPSGAARGGSLRDLLDRRAV